VAKISPPPPPPDPEVIRRAERDAEIAIAGQAVYQGEQYLGEVNNRLVGARLALALAKAAYQRTEPGSVGEFVAELAAVAAQNEVDLAMADRSRADSNLRAARDRYNRLKSEK
jgi:multidrug resistance efflux pump